jgi:hypothetical protein
MIVHYKATDDDKKADDNTAMRGFRLVFPEGWATTDTAIAPVALKAGYTMAQQLQFIGKKLLQMSVYRAAVKLPVRLVNGFLNMETIYRLTKEALWDKANAIASLYMPLVKVLELKDLELVRYTKDIYDKQSSSENDDTSTPVHDEHVAKASGRHVA